MLTFFHGIILPFVKNQMFTGVLINMQVFNSIPLVNLSVFMPVSNCFHYCSSEIELDVRDEDAARCSFIVQDYFG